MSTYHTSFTVNSLFDAYDKSCIINAILLNFTKALDGIPHLLLLDKLEAYEIQGTLFEKISSFPANGIIA